MSRRTPCSHLHFGKMAVATVQNTDLGRQDCAVDPERDGKCGGSTGREEGQNSAAPRRDDPQNDVDAGVT